MAYVNSDSNQFILKLFLTATTVGVLFWMPFTSYLYANTIMANTTNNTVTHTLTEVEALKLSTKKSWLDLLKYRKPFLSLSETSAKSVLRSKDFFYHVDGNVDSARELNAFIKAIYAFSTNDIDNASVNEHPACRSPARYKWLAQHIELPKPPTVCPEYEAWRNGTIESASLVYASGYLHSPASYYGHTLIRFNTSEEPSHLLQPTLDFGAILPDNELGPVYIAKGLLGGYDAGFTLQKFYIHAQKYGEQELRDLWEYQLDLTPEQLERLVDMSWELQGQTFGYYYLKDNCALAMAELLEAATGRKIVDRRVPWTVPVSIVQNLVNNPDSGQTKTQLTLRPSRYALLEARHNQLNETEQQTFTTYFSNRDPHTLDLDQTDASSASLLINTLLDLNQLDLGNDPENSSLQEEQRLLILKALSYPPQHSSPTLKAQDPPHAAQGTSLFQAGIGLHDGSEKILNLRWRGAYYDYLSLPTARAPFTQLAMLDLHVQRHQSDWHVQQMDIVRVGALNPPGDLPMSGGRMWEFALGWESVNFDCKDCAAARLDTSYGASFALGKRFALHTSVNAQLHENRLGQGYTSVAPQVGLVYQSMPLSLSMRVGKRMYLDGGLQDKWLPKFELRLGSSPLWDVRFTYAKDIHTQTSVAFSYYPQ